MPSEPEPSVFMAENCRYKVAVVNVWQMRSLSLTHTNAHLSTHIPSTSNHAASSYNLATQLHRGDPH